MDFTTALLSACAAMGTTITVLAAVIAVLWRRDIKRQASVERKSVADEIAADLKRAGDDRAREKQSRDAQEKIESIRDEMLARQDASEAICRSELSAARADISRLNNDVSSLALRDRDMVVKAVLFYAEKREADRELMELIADKIGVVLPKKDASSRTTVQLRAIVK